jgi:hypothetical protein
MKKIKPYIIYLLFLLLPVHAFGQTTPAITMVSSKNAGETIKINVDTQGNPFTIDWGDGTPVTGVEGDVSHALGQNKTIKIYGSYIDQLICRGNALTSIDVTNCTDLVSLDLGANNLTTIDVTHNLALVFLTLPENQLTGLDVSKNPNIANLTADKNKITSLNLTANVHLEKLYVSYNSLTALDLSKNTLITDINCDNNQITAMDLSALTKLAYFSAMSNKFTSLDFSKNKVVKGVDLSFNYNLKTVNLSEASILDLLKLSSTLVDINSVSLPGTVPLRVLYIDNTGISNLTLTRFPDLTYLNLNKNKFSNYTISHAKLSQLEISNNSEMKSLDVTGCPLLTSLYCNNGVLESLYLPQTSPLRYLYLYDQNIQGLDVSNLTALKNLDLRKNDYGLSILPVPNVNWTSYTYAPQNKVALPPSVPVNYSVDLSNQLKSTGAQTVFTWRTKDGVALVSGTDYTLSAGVTTFLKAQTDSVYCEISNTQFPLLTGSNALLTTNIKVAAIPFAGDGSNNNPFQIATLSDLRFLSENPAIWPKNYIQTANIDASDTKNWNNGKGFYPIGTFMRSFGWYDGQGYTISNLYINRPNAQWPEFAGLFGYVGGEIVNLGLINCDVTGNDQVGALAGLTTGNINNCYATGKVTGYSKVGGLIGRIGSSYITVENCYANVEVNATFTAGGFVGFGYGSVKNCYARGIVNATKNYAGGFIGDSYGNINNCYSTGTATAPYNAGGFAGYVYSGSISKCFRDNQTSSNTINIGGSVAGSSVDITNTNTSVMKTNTTYTNAGWDFMNEITNGTADIWTIYTGANNGYPCFVWQTPAPKVVTLLPAKIKNINAIGSGIISDLGSPAATSYGFCWSNSGTLLPTINDNKVNLGAATQTGAFTGSITGLSPLTSYRIRAYAQNMYGISYGRTYYFVTSNKIQLTISAPVVTLSKKYDGTNTAAVTAGTLSGVESGGDVKVSATANYEDANAGTAKNIIVSYTLTGANASEYFEPENDTIKNGEITKIQLTSTVPVFASQKLYDGTTQVSITTSGKISGIIDADLDKVTVEENALYADANAGNNKNITVTYTLSGISANNYNAPVNKEFTNGQINKIHLTISNPVIVNGKLYDGTTDAAITTGTLNGVIAADAADITVSAKAAYNDASVGEGKTITVIYTIGGMAKANYIAPANYVVNTGIIEDKIVLASIEPLTASCNGSGLNIPYSVLKGKPVEYQITFGEKALAQGFSNIAYTNVPSVSTGILTMVVPSSAIGTFEGTVQMKSALSTSDVYPFTFTVNLSSEILITKFGDVILCDNSSNKFTAYQWYKNEEAISGATKQFYNEPTGLNGNYRVKVTTTANESVMSCPITVNSILKALPEVKVFPNALAPGQQFKIQLINLSDEDLQGAVITLFNSYGNTVYQKNVSSSELSLSAPVTHGSYIGHVITKEGKNLSFRIQVNQ